MFYLFVKLSSSSHININDHHNWSSKMFQCRERNWLISFQGVSFFLKVGKVMRKFILIKVCEVLANENASIFFFFLPLTVYTFSKTYLTKKLSARKFLEVTFHIRNVSRSCITWNALWGFSSTGWWCLKLMVKLIFQEDWWLGAVGKLLFSSFPV